MKKTVIVSVLSLFMVPAFAQDVLDQAVLDQIKKDKEKSDKNIQDPKANVKAATWMDRAKLYENIALQHTTIDSNAANEAREAYKKVIELDVTKKGAPGKSAQEAEKILQGGEGTFLYNAFVTQGAQYFQGKNLKGALDAFTAAQEINTKDTTAALYGGIAAQSLDLQDQAIAGFEKYADNGGVDPSVYYGLSQLYRVKKDFPNAMKALEKGIAKAPDNKDLKAEVVNVLLDSGQEDVAIEKLKSLAESDPSNVTNILNLGILYDNAFSKTGSEIRKIENQLGAGGSKKSAVEKDIEAEKGKVEVFNEEIKRLASRIKAQPKNADLKRQLTDAQSSVKASEETLAKLNADLKALEEESKGTDVTALQKELDALKAKQAEARKNTITYYEKALSVDANNHDALNNMGIFYYNEAVELKKEVDNMNMAEYNARGKEVEGRVCGRFTKSKPYFEKAVAVNADSEAKNHLENVNMILQQFEGKNIECVE